MSKGTSRRAIAAAVLAVGLSPMAWAGVYTYTPPNTTTDLWSAGTDWTAVPVSDSTTELTFNAASLANSVNNKSTNDISAGLGGSGGFLLNILDLNGSRSGTGNSNTSASVTIDGASATALEFASNGATLPVVNLNATNGTHKPASTTYTDTLSYVINNNVVLDNTTTFTGAGSAAFQFTGVVSGNGGVTKSGTSTLQLTNAANSYTGVTTISGGSLLVSSLANGGSNSSIGASSNAASNLVFSGGFLRYTGSTAQSTDRGFTVSSGGFDASGSVATATVTISGTMVNSGTLTLKGSNTGDNTLGSTIGGTFGLQKSGTGTWVLSAANTSTGNVSIGERPASGASGGNGGTLKLASGAKLPSGALNIAGGTLDLNGTSQSVTSVTLGQAWGAAWDPANATILVGSGGTLTLKGDVSWPKDYTGAGNWHDGYITGGNLVLSGADRKFAVTNGFNANTVTVSSVIQDDGSSRGIVKAYVDTTNTGSGTLVLSGANTYTGGTRVSAGTLRIAGGNNRLPTGTVLTIDGQAASGGPAGTFDLNGLSQTVAQLAAGAKSGTGTVYGTVLNNAAGTSVLTVTGTSTFGGIIKDGAAGKYVALTKSTGGTLTLSGANTYTGPTTITGGTLALAATGSIASTQLNVAGGTFDASLSSVPTLTSLAGGGIVKATSVNSSGILAPGGMTTTAGDQIGTLSIQGDLTISGSTAGRLAFDIADLGGTSDQVIANSLSLSNLAWSDFAFNAGTFSDGTYAYTLIHNLGSLNGGLAGSGLSGTIGTNGQGELSLVGNDVVLTVSVPEPAMLGIAGVSLLGALSLRRSRVA